MDDPAVPFAFVSEREVVALCIRFRVLLGLSVGCRFDVLLERHRQFAPDDGFGRLGVHDDVRPLRGGDAGAQGKDGSAWNVVHEEDPVVGQVQ
jgi:hypothetical protein